MPLADILMCLFDVVVVVLFFLNMCVCVALSASPKCVSSGAMSLVLSVCVSLAETFHTDYTTD